MRRAFCILLTLAGAGGAAVGTPWWIAWEGDEFPEVVGPWEREWGNYSGGFQGTGAIRTIENGILTYDSLFDTGVYDFSFIEFSGPFDPGPGEVFIMEWRLKVDEIIGYPCDPELSVQSDEAWGLGFGFSTDRIISVFEYPLSFPIVPAVFHEYRAVSRTMRTYDLYVDQAFVHQGSFIHVQRPSYVGVGDGAEGVASLHRWDYFRVGVRRLGDMNCDGLLNSQDIDGFILALFDDSGRGGAYFERLPGCEPLLADMNGDGVVSAHDIDGFVGALFAE